MDSLPIEISDTPVKRCPACGERKGLNEFPRNRSTKDGYGVYCKPCHNRQGRENKIKNHGGTRHYHLKRRYGITAEDAASMLEAQGGLCDICREQPAQHVDHDHATGRVRALLCFNCNGGLGQFHDDPELLHAAIEYLERHQLASIHARVAALPRPAWE